MEQFDEFFKKKFQDRSFELKEELWLEAERLIAAQKKKKRRRWLFLWWFGGLLLLGLAGFGWFALKPDATNSDKGENQASISPFSSAQAEQGLEGLNMETKTFEAVSDSLTAAVDEQKGLENKSADNTISDETRSTDFFHSDQPVFQTDNIEEQETLQNYKFHSDSLIQADLDTGLQKLQALLPSLDYLERLALKPTFIMPKDSTLSLPKIITPSISEAPQNRAFLSADLNFSWYPYFDADTKKYLGLKLGLSYGRPLNRNISLVTALNYQQRSGTFDFFKESSKVAYRFAKTEERFKLLPEKLHYLEAVTTLGWQSQNHNLEAGLGLNYLLGIRGQLLQFSSADNFESSTVVNEGWIVEEGFKRWHLKAILGYSLRFSSKFGVGIRLHYVPGTILDKSYDFSEVFLLENRPLGMELRLRYYFF